MITGGGGGGQSWGVSDLITVALLCVFVKSVFFFEEGEFPYPPETLYMLCQRRHTKKLYLYTASSDVFISLFYVLMTDYVFRGE